MAAGIKTPFDGTLLSVGAPPVPAALGGFVGLLDFTGISVGSQTGSVIQPGTAAVEATGYAPNWVSTTGTRFFPLTASVTVEGFAPAWATPNSFRPGTGTLTVTGYAPQWVVDSRVQFGTGALTVTGYAPAWARYADCVLFDSTHLTFDTDALTWDLVSTCPVVPPVVVAANVGGGGGGRRKPKRKPPAPEPRYVPWLDPYVSWLEVANQGPAPEEPALTPAPFSAFVGKPGTVPVYPEPVSRDTPRWVPTPLVEPSMADLVDRMLDGQAIWEAMQRQRAIELEDDDEEAIMLLLT